MQLVTEAHTVDSWGRHAGRKLDICTLLLLGSQSLRHDRLTGNKAKLAHPGLTFRLPHTVLEQGVEVAQRDERRRQDRLLLVLHHYGKPLEHPHLKGPNHTIQNYDNILRVKSIY